jgi:hypothetical protein
MWHAGGSRSRQTHACGRSFYPCFLPLTARPLSSHCSCCPAPSWWSCLNFFGGGVVGSTALTQVRRRPAGGWRGPAPEAQALQAHLCPAPDPLAQLPLPQVPELVNRPFETPSRLGYALPGTATGGRRAASSRARRRHCPSARHSPFKPPYALLPASPIPCVGPRCYSVCQGAPARLHGQPAEAGPFGACHACHAAAATPRLPTPPLRLPPQFFLTVMILRTLMSVPLRFLISQPGVWQAWIRCGGRAGVRAAVAGGYDCVLGAAPALAVALPFGCAATPRALPTSASHSMALMPFLKGMRDANATERTRFMRNALRSPRYGVEFGGNLCLVMLISFAFAVRAPAATGDAPPAGLPAPARCSPAAICADAPRLPALCPPSPLPPPPRSSAPSSRCSVSPSSSETGSSGATS